MFQILKEVKSNLKELLETQIWKSVDVDYHHPRVKRLWINYGEYRVYLHEIYSCEKSDALWHSHPWPSIIEILDGSYLMDVGHSETSEKPKNVDASFILTKGCQYLMENPNGWHFVSPLSDVSYSIMITGKPWKNNAPKPTKILQELDEKEIKRLKKVFLKLMKQK